MYIDEYMYNIFLGGGIRIRHAYIIYIHVHTCTYMYSGTRNAPNTVFWLYLEKFFPPHLFLEDGQRDFWRGCFNVFKFSRFCV